MFPFFYDLPTELQTYIYEFDLTYHEKFCTVLREIKFMNAHRYFFYNEDKKLCCEYITPKNIDAFIELFREKQLSIFNSAELDSLKEKFMEEYNEVRFNLIMEKSQDLCADYIGTKLDNDTSLKIPSTWIDFSNVLFKD